MNQARDLRNIVLGAVITASGLSALAAINLTTFAPNTPIKSSEVNANFSSLRDAVEAPIGVSRLETTGTAADGKVLKLQAGGLAWADDLTGGAGGTAYSAGTGLALTGTTFSVANAGITRAMLSTSGAVADGKVLKLSGGNLTWADDLLGSAGGTYSADGTSLVLNGTVFSVKDAGIGASKIALPLSLGVNSGDAVLLGSNANIRGSGVHGRTGAASGVAPGYGAGLWGESSSDSYGVFAYSAANISLYSQNDSHTAIKGDSNSGPGIVGTSISNTGVQGSSAFRGVQGTSDTGIGMIGISNARGVIGTQGVISCPGAYAVGGCATSNVGVRGTSTTGAAASFQGGFQGGGTCFYAGGAGWDCSSDRNLKENFRTLNSRSVLEKLAHMPITRWNMKGDRNKISHVGPVAQDFKAAFGLGENDTTINSADAQGVALAAIKGMYEKNQKLENQVKTLAARLVALEKAMHSR